MATHIVKCFYCKQQFDRDKMPFVKIPNCYQRYAHAECAKENNLEVEIQQKETLKEENSDYKKLCGYINKLYGKQNINWPAITKNIQRMKTANGFTDFGILQALIYFFEIKGSSTNEKSIGIVPYVYYDAQRYFHNLDKVNKENSNAKLTTDKEIIEIQVPVRKAKKYNFFSFLNEEVIDAE